jgi:hypothetical protein
MTQALYAHMNNKTIKKKPNVKTLGTKPYKGSVVKRLPHSKFSLVGCL